MEVTWQKVLATSAALVVVVPSMYSGWSWAGESAVEKAALIRKVTLLATEMTEVKALTLVLGRGLAGLQKIHEDQEVERLANLAAFQKLCALGRLPKDSAECVQVRTWEKTK